MLLLLILPSRPYKILAPTAYIFFALALPVIAFGEQLNRDTDGTLSTVMSDPLDTRWTATLDFWSYRTYHYQEQFRQEVCVWTALLLLLLATFKAFAIISRIMRIAGELFVMLIAVLFFQEAIKWLCTNGLLAVIFSFGLLLTSINSRRARCWHYGTGYALLALEVLIHPRALPLGDFQSSADVLKSFHGKNTQTYYEDDLYERCVVNG